MPTPSVASDFADNMKFSDCLPQDLALEVARQRLIDPDGVTRALAELDGGGSAGGEVWVHFDL